MNNNSWNYHNTLNHRPKKSIWKLEEKLIPATLDRLKQEMVKRPKLDSLLHTPICKINSIHHNLYDPEYIENYKNETLLDIITEQMNTKDCIYFYSQTQDDWLEGFACYQVNRLGTMVTEITIFTFDPDNINFVLIDDIRRLLRELTTKFSVVRFQCIEDQPVLKAYQKATDELGGTYELDEGVWYFEIMK